MKNIVLMCMLLWLSQVSFVVAEDYDKSSELSQAIAALRHVNPDDISDEKGDTKRKTLEKAWKVLSDAGQKGVDAVKNESKKIDVAKEKDDYFKLVAGSIIWKAGKIDEAKNIAALWSGDVDLSCFYSGVFFTAYEAAQTQDERVLPILVATLKDNKGVVFVSQHYLEIRWPLSHVFIWGSYGSKGVPALREVLNTSNDKMAIASAIGLLAMDMDVKSLSKIRELAKSESEPVRTAAVKALGRFGHPDDFEFLAEGLISKDADDVYSFAYALYEYGDLRAVSEIVKLLSSTKDAKLKYEMTACLFQLVTPEGIEAIQQLSKDSDDEKYKRYCQNGIQGMCKALGMSYETYAAKSKDEKVELAAKLRDKIQDKYCIKADDKQLTHDDFLKAAEGWKKTNRITGGDYEWIEDRHILSAATYKDVPLLLDVSAACLKRLSDECLYDIQTLQGLIMRLGRSEYRREVGLCEKCKPPAEKK